jgi:uncharacterized protein YfcZ (UPF0381/DUF406 family)
VIKVRYKAVSNKQPIKADWRTVKEFFEDAELVPLGGTWSVEDGSVYVERVYETNKQWEERIDFFHQKDADRVRSYRYEIVEEINGDEDGISS